MRLPSKKTAVIVLLACLVIFAAVFSLLRSGYPRNHDLELYPIWQSEFHAGLTDGHLLPRWSANVWLGYGSPIFNFTQPLYFYLVELWHLVGFSIVNSIKLALILITLGGFWFMYLFTRQYFGRLGALLSAAVFTLAPYRIGLVYNRGAFSEYLAMSLVPLCFYAVVRLGRARTWRNFILLTGAVAALMLSHNISVLMLFPPLIVFMLLFSKKTVQNYLVQAAAFIAGLMLTAFFWVPAFFERQYLKLDNLTTGPYDFHNNFSSIKELLFSNYWNNGVVFLQVSFIASFICLMAAALIIIHWRSVKASRPAAFFLVLAIGSFICATVWSRALWETIPLMKFIQFPWRFIGLIDFGTGFLAGLIVWPGVQKTFSWLARKIRPRWSYSFLPISAAFCGLLVISSTEWLGPLGGYLPQKSDASYQPNQQLVEQFLTSDYFNTFGIKSAIFPRYNNLEALQGRIEKTILEARDRVLAGQPADWPKTEAIEGAGAVSPIRLETGREEYAINADTIMRVRINTFYFPGWTARLDNELTTISLDPDFGLMEFTVPAGRHELKLFYGNTPLRAFAGLVSFLTFLGLATYTTKSLLSSAKISIASAKADKNNP